MYLQRWTDALESNYQRTSPMAPMRTLFNMVVYKPPDELQNYEVNKNVSEICVAVSRSLSDAGSYTILDALQCVFCGSDLPACIKTFSDIILIRLKREDREGGAGVEILPKLTLARFAFENYDKLIEGLRTEGGIKETLGKLRTQEDELTWIEANGKRYISTEILRGTISCLERMEGEKYIEDIDDDEPERMDVDSERVLPSLTGQMNAALDSVNSRVQGTAHSIFHL